MRADLPLGPPSLGQQETEVGCTALGNGQISLAPSHVYTQGFSTPWDCMNDITKTIIENPAKMTNSRLEAVGFDGS